MSQSEMMSNVSHFMNSAVDAIGPSIRYLVAMGLPLLDFFLTPKFFSGRYPNCKIIVAMMNEHAMDAQIA